MSEALERQLARSARVVPALLLVNRVCISLSLTDRASTCDTLVNLTCSLLELRRGAILLARDKNVHYACDTPQELQDAQDSVLWSTLQAERAPRVVASAEVARDWPTAPAWCAAGFASAPIDIADRAAGAFFVGMPISGEPFAAEDLELLSGCAGITALALANADLHAARDQSLEEARRQSEAARTLFEEQQRAVELNRLQRTAIRELSAPILHVWDHTVALPVVGVLDAERSAAMTDKLLHVITTQGAHNVIIDLTGIEDLEAMSARLLLDMVKAATLLGARCFVSGVRPNVAVVLAELQLDLTSVSLRRTLREALASCR